MQTSQASVTVRSARQGLVTDPKRRTHKVRNTASAALTSTYVIVSKPNKFFRTVVTEKSRSSIQTVCALETLSSAKDGTIEDDGAAETFLHVWQASETVLPLMTSNADAKDRYRVTGSAFTSTHVKVSAPNTPPSTEKSGSSLQTVGTFETLGAKLEPSRMMTSLTLISLGLIDACTDGTSDAVIDGSLLALTLGNEESVTLGRLEIFTDVTADAVNDRALLALTLSSTEAITLVLLEALTDGTTDTVNDRALLALTLGSTEAITLGLLEALTSDGTADTVNDGELLP